MDVRLAELRRSVLSHRHAHGPQVDTLPSRKSTDLRSELEKLIHSILWNPTLLAIVRGEVETEQKLCKSSLQHQGIVRRAPFVRAVESQPVNSDSEQKEV